MSSRKVSWSHGKGREEETNQAFGALLTWDGGSCWNDSRDSRLSNSDGSGRWWWWRPRLGVRVAANDKDVREDDAGPAGELSAEVERGQLEVTSKIDESTYADPGGAGARMKVLSKERTPLLGTAKVGERSDLRLASSASIKPYTR